MKKMTVFVLFALLNLGFVNHSFGLYLPPLKLNSGEKLTLSSIRKIESGNPLLKNLPSDEKSFLSSTIKLKETNIFDKRINNNFKSDYILQKSLSENPKPFTRFNPGDYKTWESKKRFLPAITEMALLEFIPFAFSAYLKDWTGSTEKNWTKISWQSAWHNLNHGWFYDGDNFLTNLFAHPYHGNLFFNAGRSNGYSFWESTFFSMAGSAFWEHFMETWEPAFNDWVLTSMNGINLGEITYRLSTLITDNKARGSTRMWTEIAAAIINPVRGVNRLISGESSRIFDNPSWRTPENLHVLFSAGVRKLDDKKGENFANESVEQGDFEFILLYNDVLRSSFNTPFSAFRINLALATGPFQLSELHGEGNLFGYQLNKKKTNKYFFITSLRYDYVNNPGFLFGSASISPDLYNVRRLSKHINFVGKLGLRLSPMSATPNDYFAGPEGRNYDFGPLLGWDVGFSIKKGPWNIVGLGYTGGRLWTQSDPARSKHNLHFAHLDLEYPMKDFFVIGASLGGYWRHSTYDDFDDVDFKTPIVKIYFRTAVL